jgi:hypothetical protein
MAEIGIESEAGISTRYGVLKGCAQRSPLTKSQQKGARAGSAGRAGRISGSGVRCIKDPPSASQTTRDPTIRPAQRCSGPLPINSIPSAISLVILPLISPLIPPTLAFRRPYPTLFYLSAATWYIFFFRQTIHSILLPIDAPNSCDKPVSRVFCFFIFAFAESSFYISAVVAVPQLFSSKTLACDIPTP